MRQTVTWVGDIDIAAHDELQVRIHAALAVPSVRQLVIDLHQVTFLDSEGIALLLDARNVGLDVGAEIVLCGVPAPVARLLNITGLTGLFTTR